MKPDAQKLDLQSGHADLEQFELPVEGMLSCLH
jgi:hypothetical protein